MFNKQHIMWNNSFAINYIKLIIITLLILQINSWQTSDILINFNQLLNITDFRQYFIKKTTLSNTQYLIIFGGYSINATNNYTVLYNNLYKINLLTKQTKQLAINKLIKPSPKFNTCGTIVRDRLIIYGGYQNNNQLSNQLWEYQFLIDQWTLRGTSYTISNCQFMITTNIYSNDTVTLIGLLQNNQTMKFVQYLIFNQTFFYNFTVLNYNSLQLNTNLWDGNLFTSYLRIQQLSDLVGTTFVANSQIHLPIKYYCLVRISQNFYIMITNNGMYYVKKISANYKIQFYYQRNQQSIDQNIVCASINSWFFFIYTQTSNDNNTLKDITIEYLHGSTFTYGILHKNKLTLYSQWIKSISYYSSFVFNNSIFIINQNLQIYYLSQTCSDFASSTKNVLQCAFGMYSCIQGWTGLGCSIPVCGGSLRLYDSYNFTQINIQCSGNGKCIASGCQCYQNWIGESCQIYQKKHCKGLLTQNFIQSNCECNEPTTGGNQCTVVFCYNDCSGHGKCQSSGQCTCNDGYLGPDCSILQINFDSIQ